MAIKTHYEIKYSCGHKETKDLSERPAGKRASFAKWAERQKCSTCYRKDGMESQRAEQLADADAFAERCHLAPLEGSEAQLRWAPIFRHRLLGRAHDLLVMEQEITEEEFDERILNFARKISRAGWWMDQIDAEAEDVEELVSTAFHDSAETITENPF